MKLCTDCKHCKLADRHSIPASKIKYAICTSPKNINGADVPAEVGGVAYGASYKWMYCAQHREDGWFDSIQLGTCGKRGRWFEPKEGSNA